jgi:hypothetical protein
VPAARLGGAGDLGYVDVGLAVQVSPPNRGLPEGGPHLGAVVYGAEPISFDLADEQTFGVGLRVDLLNQVLWSIWYSGAMDVPALTELLEGSADFAGIEGSLQASLPPVVMPAADLDGVQVAMGDAFLSLDVDVARALPILESPPFARAKMQVFASFVVGAHFGIDERSDHLFFTFDPEPEINLQVTSIEYAEYEGHLSELVTRVLEHVIPQILQEAVVSFPLPALDISPCVGQNAALRIADGTVDQTPGYIRMQGSVQAIPARPHAPGATSVSDRLKNICSGLP